MLQTGEMLQSRYEIIKVIGVGGMSTVYQARDISSGALLAVKDVKRSSESKNEVVEQSLSAEGRMLKKLSNPHLPRIYDIIEEPDKIMLIMDFIQGESLDKVISREGPQSMDRVLNWGMQICEVFHYLHNQPTPVIYRDMKPANVMLQPDGKLMMIDFGTARTQKVGVAMQADTICIGTAGFAAPEQFGGIGQSTARTDIFCLGATLYNMITGHSPCDKPVGILPLEYWNPALAGTPLAEIITKCTRNDPNERYQTAMELHEDLRLASIGAYQTGGKKGKTGYFTGNLRKNEWQKQDVQGMGMLTSGLSDILHRGIGSISGQLQNKETHDTAAQKQPHVGAEHTACYADQSNVIGHWQTSNMQAAVQNTNHVHTQQQQQEDTSLLSKLILIAMLVAAIFVVLSIVLVVLKQTAAATVFLLIAVLAAVGGAACLVISRRG